ncbi:HNH endonuclease [Cryobacterium cheniae]|uniref:HNH endonuclease n=2 Tax=Cryobacterium cheniae TaxID=1259262 RepID=A0A4R8XX04_9MICO|nr:HNH endonuclease [Cryobacterium cheniae]
MPRSRVRTLHTTDCRGCGAPFPHHSRSKAYCSTSCRALYIYAQSKRCLGCKADESQLVVYTSIQVKLDEEERALDFAAAHLACRRKMVDELGPPRICDCKFCTTEAGLPPAISPYSKSSPSKMTRSGNYRKLGPAVYERDGWTCQICFLRILPDVHPSDDLYPNLDHIVGVEDGGDDSIDNLRATHRWCNIMRHGSPYMSDDNTIGGIAIARFSNRLDTLLD